MSASSVRLIVATLAWMACGTVSAASVFIQAGNAEGQGYAFKMNRSCLIFTANHVVETVKQAEIVSPEGERAEATVIGRDAELDLALLQVPDVAKRPTPRLCSGETSMPLAVPERLTNIGRRAHLRIQRVPSRAGAIDHVAVRVQAVSADSPWFKIALTNAEDAVVQGDSGSTVWLENATPHPGRESRGTIVGMVVAVEADGVKALRADELQQAVYRMMWPIDTRKLKLNVGSDTRVDLVWGAVPKAGSMNWNNGASSIYLTLDLGDRDTTVAGVTASQGAAKSFANSLLAAIAPQASKPGVRARIGVETSSNRPGEGEIWKGQRCVARQSTVNGAACEFVSPMIARGVRIEFEGDISALSSIVLHTIE